MNMAPYADEAEYCWLAASLQTKVSGTPGKSSTCSNKARPLRPRTFHTKQLKFDDIGNNKERQRVGLHGN
jgi:hypothetical protein